MYFFFFFQAEDGIRDYKVTGVQTCALPIWCDLGQRALLPAACGRVLRVSCNGACADGGYSFCSRGAVCPMSGCHFPAGVPGIAWHECGCRLTEAKPDVYTIPANSSVS